MSALVKSGAGIATLPVARAAVLEPAIDPRDAMIEMLRGQIAELHAAAEQAAAVVETRIAEAADRAAATARSAMRRDDAVRISLLETALETAQAAFDARLAQLERLAPALARVAIDRLFAASAERAALIEALVIKRLEALRRDAIVAVAVSAEDFDEALLADLTLRIGTVVGFDADLPGGHCRIAATVETLALDLDGEWAALAAALDAMEGGA